MTGEEATVIPGRRKEFCLESALSFLGRGITAAWSEIIEGILHDISRETGLVSEKIDRLQYLEAMGQAEAALIYKSIAFKPLVRTEPSNQPALGCEIANLGNTDLELIYAEATIPRWLCANNRSPHTYPNTLDFNLVAQDGIESWNVKYWSQSSGTDDTAFDASLNSQLENCHAHLPSLSIEP